MVKNIGNLFLDKTKFEHLVPSDQMRGIKSPPLEIPYDPSAKLLSLPDPHTVQSEMLVQDAIETRRSIRTYSPAPISLEELSYLLWCTQGIQEVYNNSVALRTVPSAGARHALETYLLINNIHGLQKGLYRYLARHHSLILLSTASGLPEQITHACLGQQFIQTSAATFLWVAVPERVTWRYSERGYRYLFLDVGHVCQNLYLAGESVNCGVCAIGAFMDDDLNSLLCLDGRTQFVIYLATVGKKEIAVH